MWLTSSYWTALLYLSPHSRGILLCGVILFQTLQLTLHLSWPKSLRWLMGRKVTWPLLSDITTCQISPLSLPLLFTQDCALLFKPCPAIFSLVAFASQVPSVDNFLPLDAYLCVLFPSFLQDSAQLSVRQKCLITPCQHFFIHQFSPQYFSVCTADLHFLACMTIICP